MGLLAPPALSWMSPKDTSSPTLDFRDRLRSGKASWKGFGDRNRSSPWALVSCPGA